MALLDELTRQGLIVPDEAVRGGLANARVAGEARAFRGAGVEVLIDAAHNPAGARALASHLNDIGWSRVTLLFGAMHDKDVAGMLEAVGPRCAGDRVHDGAEPSRAVGHEARAPGPAFRAVGRSDRRSGGGARASARPWKARCRRGLHLSHRTPA